MLKHGFDTNLRVSSYMIPIKLEKGNGKYVLIHGYTGVMDIVRENVVLKLENNDITGFSETNVTNFTKKGLRNRKNKGRRN